jgi:UDP-N-acetylglucosamine enolpyruvyl transferase
MMSEILVPVSFGELLDKMAILEIKCERIRDAAKLANVQRELDALNLTWAAHPAAATDIRELRARLKAINESLWDIEDDIRDKERAGEFDDEFVRLARAVYVTNDERARVKKEINLKLGSAYVEEKSYADYGPPA